ncbi:ATP-binding cassette domain-containing protein [Spiroplasma endosymbiont of Aspidapion aeneum]|uniref:ATP-binding cassette domain-containing protein n=1 Tax=Spiroplasma endosymbiont of Aspidapion aeneum TaxID=3066276 RepID=UPI00313E0B99
MIRINNLSKIYNENCGNFSININIDKGQIYGVVGPNGAGKTTLVKQILGLITPSEGEIFINNYRPIIDNCFIMRDTGYISGENSLFNNIKGIKILEYNKKIKYNVDWEWTLKLIEYFELDVNKKMKKMSKGMKQKLSIITALMNKPKIIIMDEPTSGLDPVMQNRFNKLILEVKEGWESTIIICSHSYDEISALCDRVCLLKSGKIFKEYNLEKDNIDIIKNDFINIFNKEITI